MKRMMSRATCGWLVWGMSMMLSLSQPGVSLAYEKEIGELSAAIAENIAKSGKTLVAVVDFTDLQGNVTELGRFIAEEFSVALAGAGKGFQVMDRAHLNRILQEHKLIAAGIIDPATVSQLGPIARVEALVTGTITPFEENVWVFVKVADARTAKLISACTGNIPKTGVITELLGKGMETVSDAAIPTPTPTSTPKDKLKATAQSVGVVETQRDPLNIRRGPGKQYKVIAKAAKGEKLIIIESSGEWDKVQLQNGIVGYASNEFIRILQN
jgi:TolB-like protein